MHLNDAPNRYFHSSLKWGEKNLFLGWKLLEKKKKKSKSHTRQFSSGFSRGADTSVQPKEDDDE